ESAIAIPPGFAIDDLLRQEFTMFIVGRPVSLSFAATAQVGPSFRGDPAVDAFSTAEANRTNQAFTWQVGDQSFDDLRVAGHVQYGVLRLYTWRLWGGLLWQWRDGVSMGGNRTTIPPPTGFDRVSASRGNVVTGRVWIPELILFTHALDDDQ